VTNAIKYTPNGGKVKLALRARKTDVLISVSDSGWGIPLYSQDQVFSKFFRAHNIVNRETSGIGLGLYLVKGLLDAIGGHIWFDSEEGKGTTFFITLPKREDKAPQLDDDADSHVLSVKKATRQPKPNVV
jgi:two-component system sensor histidine kinase VicK